MTPERDQQIMDVFLAAVEKPEGCRCAYLDEACNTDQELRAEVESLLKHHVQYHTVNFVRLAPSVFMITVEAQGPQEYNPHSKVWRRRGLCNARPSRLRSLAAPSYAAPSICLSITLDNEVHDYL